jgi:hypothetical protein
MTAPQKTRPAAPAATLAIALALAAALACGAPDLMAQGAQAQEPGTSERERQDINTIATLSVGLVIQSFGYIGVYGDLLSSGSYESGQVIAMLGETVRYLSNAHRELARYQNPAFGVSAGDRQYLADVATIVELLIVEAESLRAFAQNRTEANLAKYRDARATVLTRIDRLVD